MISCAVMRVRIAALYETTSNSALPSASSTFTNLIRLIDARLQAESLRNMYSEHGLEA